MSLETSREARVPLNVEVIRADDVEPGIYTAVNLSAGGICLQSPHKQEVGGFVALDFKLDEQDLNVYAEVVWCRSDQATGSAAGPHTVGLKFMTPGASTLRAIHAYVASHLRSLR